jgi:hypothetical protein
LIAETGQPLEKDYWDVDQVVLTTRAGANTTTWDKQVIIPDDPDLADRAFQAELELARRVGVYCYPPNV